MSLLRRTGIMRLVLVVVLCMTASAVSWPQPAFEKHGTPPIYSKSAGELGLDVEIPGPGDAGSLLQPRLLLTPAFAVRDLAVVLIPPEGAFAALAADTSVPKAIEAGRTVAVDLDVIPHGPGRHRISIIVTADSDRGTVIGSVVAVVEARGASGSEAPAGIEDGVKSLPALEQVR